MPCFVGKWPTFLTRNGANQSERVATERERARARARRSLQLAGPGQMVGRPIKFLSRGFQSSRPYIYVFIYIYTSVCVYSLATLFPLIPVPAGNCATYHIIPRILVAPCRSEELELRCASHA